MRSKLCTIIIVLCLVYPSIVLSEQLERIIDGDTIVLQGGERVRLYGIDSPEMSTDAGIKARDFLVSYIPLGSELKVEREAIDHYGRTVALLYFKGECLNRVMVVNGHAQVWGKYCKRSECKEWWMNSRLPLK